MRFKAKNIIPLIDGLSTVSDLKILAGGNKQVHNLENGVYSYEPDRTDGSGYCVVKPYVSAIDPNNVAVGDQPITSATWYWNGVQVIPSATPANDDIEVNNNNFTAKVKLNVIAGATSVLKCVYTFTDQRKGTSITMERTMDFTTTSFNCDAYKLYLDGDEFNSTSATRESSDNLVKTYPLYMHKGSQRLNTGVVYRLFEKVDGTWLPITAAKAADCIWLRSVITDVNGTIQLSTNGGVETCNLSIDHWTLPGGVQTVRVYALPQGRTEYKTIWMKEITFALDKPRDIDGETRMNRGSAFRNVNSTTEIEAQLILSNNKQTLNNPEREYACRWTKNNGNVSQPIGYGYELSTDTFELELRKMTDVGIVSPEVDYLGEYKLITCGEVTEGGITSPIALQDGDNALIVSH